VTGLPFPPAVILSGFVRRPGRVRLKAPAKPGNSAGMTRKRHDRPNNCERRDNGGRRIAALWLISALLLVPATVQATDYERNDVSSRALGITATIVPVSNKPLAMLVHGAARKHNRFLVLGTELLAGIAFDGRPVLIAGGFVGLESTDSGWTKIRGYGEIGANFMYADSRLIEALIFRVEGGLRYQFQTHARPHWQMQFGARVMTNFSHTGWAFPVSIVWVFD
jgi:hypothetical protein